jgi:O-antigen/teichoic acid export membrane protein
VTERIAAIRGVIAARRSNELHWQLFSGATGTLALNVATIAANFAIAVVLARLLGAAGYGVYAFATAWSSVLLVPAVLGLPPLLVRNVVQYEYNGTLDLMRGLLRRANQLILGLSSLLVLVAGLLGWWAYGSDSGSLHAYWLALLIVPVVGLTSIRGATMQGLGRIVLARVPAAVVAPLLLLLAVGVASLLPGKLAPSTAVGLTVASSVFALALLTFLLRRTLPAATMTSPPRYESRVWLRSALPLVLFSGIQALNAQASIIMLGLLNDNAEVGVYSVSARAASVISFLLLTVRYPLGPTLARLHAARDHDRLQQVVTRSAQVTLVLTLPLALSLFIFAGPLLGLFGGGFGSGTTVLRILSVGEFINVATGVAGMVLVMTGHEAKMTKGIAAGAVVGIGLNLLLIPVWGATGAAVATAAGVIVSNLLLVALAWRAVRIYSAAVWLPWLAR